MRSCDPYPQNVKQNQTSFFFFFIRIQNSRILLWTSWSVWKSTIWAFIAWLLSQTSHSLHFMPISETVVATFLSLVHGCPCFLLLVLFWHWLEHAGNTWIRRCTDPFIQSWQLSYLLKSVLLPVCFVFFLLFFHQKLLKWMCIMINSTLHRNIGIINICIMLTRVWTLACAYILYTPPFTLQEYFCSTLPVLLSFSAGHS